jgi:hypothetical protein
MDLIYIISSKMQNPCTPFLPRFIVLEFRQQQQIRLEEGFFFYNNFPFWCGLLLLFSFTSFLPKNHYALWFGGVIFYTYNFLYILLYTYYYYYYSPFLIVINVIMGSRQKTKVCAFVIFFPSFFGLLFVVRKFTCCR